jgi:hypothetical protein
MTADVGPQERGRFGTLFVAYTPLSVGLSWAPWQAHPSSPQPAHAGFLIYGEDGVVAPQLTQVSHRVDHGRQPRATPAEPIPQYLCEPAIALTTMCSTARAVTRLVCP